MRLAYHINPSFWPLAYLSIFHHPRGRCLTANDLQGKSGANRHSQFSIVE
jgi:hypothetical protein